MKTPLTIFALALALASCSRSGTTIANDDSAINGQLTPAATTTRFNGEYPVTEKALPQEVKTAFYRRYPDAQSAQWVLVMKDGTYKVDFFILKIKWQAIFTPDGALISEEHA